ncbi:MAG: hypothetical protein JW864_02730 [Spirochaetes bacterium]|nr:hypothetical protein [Spirochaetota bacterium]
MSEGKYDKYFIEFDPNEWPEDMRPVMVRMDNHIAEGCHFYLIHWVKPGFGDMFGKEPLTGHPPHIHKSAELLIHIGTNPDDPMDLGAEIEMYMGPELERHVFNRTTVIWIPPNFIHSPWKPLRIDRPFIFMEINQGPVHTEKSYRQLLPKAVREKMDWENMWVDEGYD